MEPDRAVEGMKLWKLTSQGTMLDAEYGKRTDEDAERILWEPTEAQKEGIGQVRFYSNVLTRIPPVKLLCTFHALTYLGLSNNHIVSVPASISVLVKLTYLGLFKNKLSFISPHALGPLTLLADLRLQGNSLLPKDMQINVLTPLEVVDLKKKVTSHFGIVQACRDNCTRVIVTLLGTLRYRKRSALLLRFLDKNIMRMICCNVYASRNSPAWALKE